MAETSDFGAGTQLDSEIIIIIIIMSCRLHGYPWPSLATSPYLAGLLDYIPYPHIAAVCMLKLVILLLPGHMRGSIGVHHSWARPCLLQLCPTCLVHLTWIVFMMGTGDCIVGALWDVSLPGLVQYCSQHSCVIAV